MKKIRIGILGTSDIAFRRFLPALKQSENFEYIGIASRDLKKTTTFVNEFGGKVFEGYEKLIKSDEIDAVYIPLPPALHFEWAKKALINGKHVLLEKPFTTSLDDTKELIRLAEKLKLVLHENYMFMYHSQLKYICNIIKSGDIGEIREYKINFGFPRRSKNDFRYNSKLGGGSLLDCGGYTIKLASILLGERSTIVGSALNYEDDIDLCGTVMMKNDKNIFAQLSFGMDNSYKCSLEVWGSKGTIFTNRIFTAPVELKPEILITKDNKINKIILDEDNQFLNSIMHFEKCIFNDEYRKENYMEIMKQQQFIENVRR